MKQQLISLVHELSDQQSNRMLLMVKQLLSDRRGTNTTKLAFDIQDGESEEFKRVERF